MLRWGTGGRHPPPPNRGGSSPTPGFPPPPFFLPPPTFGSTAKPPRSQRLAFGMRRGLHHMAGGTKTAFFLLFFFFAGEDNHSPAPPPPLSSHGLVSPLPSPVLGRGRRGWSPAGPPSLCRAWQGPRRFAGPGSSRPSFVQDPVSCRMRPHAGPLRCELEAAGGGEAAGALCPSLAFCQRICKPCFVCNVRPRQESLLLCSVTELLQCAAWKSSVRVSGLQHSAGLAAHGVVFNAYLI